MAKNEPENLVASLDDGPDSTSGPTGVDFGPAYAAHGLAPDGGAGQGPAGTGQPPLVDPAIAAQVGGVLADAIERALTAGAALYGRKLGLTSEQIREHTATIGGGLTESDRQRAGELWGKVLLQYGASWAMSPAGALTLFYLTRIPGGLTLAAEMRTTAENPKPNEDIQK